MKIGIKNISFEVEKSDYDLFWEDIGSDKWEPETFHIIDRFLDAGGTMIDLGCWGGPISLYAAHKAGKIYAIDPDPEIFIHLQENLKLNPTLSEKIKSFNLAILPKNENALLYAREKYGLSSTSVLPRLRDKVYTHTSKGITLETFIENEGIQNADLIKMDIEGAEFAVLEGLGKSFEKINFPTLHVSFHYNYLREHFYHLRIKNKFVSKALMKIENILGLDLFRGKNKKIILKAFRAFESYKFIYTEKGHRLSLDQLRNDPFIIKNNNLVVSNKEWPV